MVEKVRFQASLSSGETCQEGVGLYQEIKGEPSPWRRLKAYMGLTNAEIVSLSLITADGHTYNLPSAGKNPNFKPFRVAEKPITYEVRRAVGTELKIGGTIDPTTSRGELKDFYTIAVAVYTEYELQLWVSELDPKNCWTLVVNKIGAICQ